MTTETSETRTETTAPAAALADVRRSLRAARDLLRELPDPAGDLAAEAEGEVAANPPFGEHERECDVLWRRVARVERAVAALDAALVAADRARAEAEAGASPAPPSAAPATARDLAAGEARAAARPEAEAAVGALRGLPGEARAVRRVLVLTGAALARAAETVTTTRAKAAAERLEARLTEALARHREATEREAEECAAAVKRWKALERGATR